MKKLFLTPEQAAWLSRAARGNGHYEPLLRDLEVQREGLVLPLSAKQAQEFREYLIENPDGQILEGILADLEDMD